MEDEIQHFIDSILDIEFIDYKIDLCFTAVYYYLHNHAVEIDERFIMKEVLQHAIQIYPEICNVTWDEFIDNKTMYNAFHNTFCKAFCKWRERGWFGMTATMIKDAESMMYVCDASTTFPACYRSTNVRIGV